MQRKLRFIAVAGAALGASACLAGPALAAPTLSGAGSTLVAPLEAYWATAFSNKYGINVSYQAVGSGTGIKDISSRLVDFGASDAPMTQSQFDSCGNCVQIPWALSATGVGFNIPGVRRLRISGPVLAQIYEGQITNWSDSRIQSENPGVRMPNLTITPVYRSDGSGDTYAFTDFLSAVSSSWRSSVGRGTSVSFPKGVGGKGNSGVASILQNTQGSVAYVAVSYLLANNLAAAAVQNAAGRYEYPNLANIESAASIVKHVNADDSIHIVDPSPKARIAYPISTFTYVIAPRGAHSGYALRRWIGYCLTTGQRFGPSLDFAPLPKVVLRAAKSALGAV